MPTQLTCHTSHTESIPQVTARELNDLFAAAWTNHKESQFRSILEHSLAYIGAYDGGRLVGFVNVAWDGGIHGFLLDTTVHTDYQGHGIGSQLVERAAEVTAQNGVEWLHVDYEPQLEDFYQACGFTETRAGF
jgi:GNAT superfamily N-acetyltransferase